MLGRGQQDDPARLADADRGLHVAGEEQSLHAHDVGFMERQQLVDERVDRQQPLGEWQVGARGQAAVVDLAQAAAGPFDDPVAKRGRPRVDPEDLHPATSA